MLAKRSAIPFFACLAASAAVYLASAFTGFAQTPEPKVYLFTWYDSKATNDMVGDWIIVGNLEDHSAAAEVYFGDESIPRESLTIAANDQAVVNWDDTIGGPVRVVAPDGDTLVVTQRVLYKGSFNEVGAVDATNLDDTYHFTWYDSKAANNMNGNWIMVTNADQQEAQVDIYIGDELMGNYAIPVGGYITPSYMDQMGGPVKVTSTNGQHLIVSQRVLCNSGFNEVMGVPEHELDTAYFFTWYDMKPANGMKGNWILISNDTDKTLEADVYIGPSSILKGTYAIGPKQSIAPLYPNYMDGPVRIICKNCNSDDKILVSQRILYQDCFEEVQGTPPAGFSDELYFGWYDLSAGGWWNGSWLLIANQGVGTATVDVFLGTDVTPLGTYTIAEGGRVTPQYPGVVGGPVRVVSRNGQPLLASQRSLYKQSFNEMLGLTQRDVGSPLVAEPDMSLYRLNVYWASMADYQARLLSVDLRVANSGISDSFNVSLTSITASGGVTVANPVPVALGDIPGYGGYVNSTIKYNLPPNLQSFTTTISAQCQDVDGHWYYFH